MRQNAAMHENASQSRQIPTHATAYFLPESLRQSLPAAGIIEESESARGEGGKVGKGRVGFRV